MSGPTPLHLQGISKSYDSVQALRPLWLDVAPGELLALLGPSGCGKTTTLRIIAGFETPDCAGHAGRRAPGPAKPYSAAVVAGAGNPARPVGVANRPAKEVLLAGSCLPLQTAGRKRSAGVHPDVIKLRAIDQEALAFVIASYRFILSTRKTGICRINRY